MIDTFSKALTEKDNEVLELKRGCKQCQIDLETVDNANRQLVEEVKQQASQYQQLQSQFI